MKRAVVFLLAMMASAFAMLADSVAAPADTLARATVDSIAGGSMMWVPDSLRGDVEMLLRGHRKVVFDDTKIDMTERVVFKGDTVPMVLKSKNYGRYDRGLFNFLFIPKGQWSFGLTASYGEFSSSDLEVFDVISDFDFTGHVFSIRPYMSYFVKNNLSIGLRLSYTSGKGSLGSLKVDIDDDMNFDLSDVMYRNESYTAAITLNQYFGLSRRGRFGVFNEVELAFSSGNSDFQRKYGGVPRLTHTTYSTAALNFSPGVCVFLMKNFSFNVSFGVFGFKIRSEKQTVDGVKAGSRVTSGANFRFNIFNIALGIALHV